MTLILSPSRGAKYSKCGEAYRLGYVERVPELPSLALIGGRAFHSWGHDVEFTRVIREFRTVEPFAVYFEAELAKAEEESWLDRSQFKTSGRKTKDRPNGEDIAYWRDVLGPQMCELFLAQDWDGWQVATDLPPDSTGNTIGLEYHLEIPGWQGYVDRIDKDANGNLRAVDFKTGQRFYPSTQGEEYQVAGRIAGLPVWYFAYYLARKGTLETKMSTWDVNTFEEYQALQRHGIETGFFPPNPGEHCGWCSYAPHCRFRV